MKAVTRAGDVIEVTRGRDPCAGSDQHRAGTATATATATTLPLPLPLPLDPQTSPAHATLACATEVATALCCTSRHARSARYALLSVASLLSAHDASRDPEVASSFQNVPMPNMVPLPGPLPGSRAKGPGHAGTQTSLGSGPAGWDADRSGSRRLVGGGRRGHGPAAQAGVLTASETPAIRGTDGLSAEGN
jgi:hypothetical protein